MISIEEAIAAVRENLPAPRVETVPLDRSPGRRIAAPFTAREPSPRFDNSAMDGFAVRWDDIKAASAASPAELEVVGESRAGAPFAGVVGPGCAVVISTGAMMPAGADTVVRVEDTETAGGRVRTAVAGERGRDVRRAGEEYRPGDVLVEAGTLLGSRHTAILAAAGASAVGVFVRPRTAIVVTGSELAPAGGAEPGPGMIRDSNRPMLAAAVAEAGGEVVRQDRVGDDPAATVAAVAAAVEARAEVVVCAGGVSVGPHDHVREAAAAAGFSEVFWRVRQKPGKPLFLAVNGRTMLFGLPGNPVSAYVCFQHYVKPALAAIGGGGWRQAGTTCVCGAGMENRGRRPVFARVRLAEAAGGVPRAFPVERQGSHMLTSIAAADGYVRLDPGAAVAEGERVEVFLF